MKGYIYYSKIDSLKNHLFIKDVINEATLIGIVLQLLVDDEQPDANADFIFFRNRNPEKVKSFEQQGFRVFNRAEVNKIANNKLRSFELATLLGIPAVPTKKIRVIEEIQAYPVVLKTVDGHGGNEVFLCASEDEAKSFFSKLSDKELIVQPYIESGSRDIRVFMIGDEVLGAVKRTGNGSFKSNYTMGGSVEKYTLSGWQEKHAEKIARALNSDYIGIDFLLLLDGSWLLNEIEDPVGARSLYKTHEFSVAKKIVAYIHKCLHKH